jgi:succinate dehydrogenase / fumarate reductase iron-sulfur subunit
MGNMPVIKDLIVDMDAVHWKKIQRVTPWLHQQGADPRARVPRPARERWSTSRSPWPASSAAPACRTACRWRSTRCSSGPAALAKAYRFVGDPRDAQQRERLKDLAEDPHGMYDCTHCFNVHRGVPEGRRPDEPDHALRRRAGGDHHIEDRNNGYRHEKAFVKNIYKNGLLHEADLLPDSYGGKFHPRAVPELLSSLPAITKALLRRKVTPAKALLHQHKAPKDVKAIYDLIENRPERDELNLYISGYDED